MKLPTLGSVRLYNLYKGVTTFGVLCLMGVSPVGSSNRLAARQWSSVIRLSFPSENDVVHVNVSCVWCARQYLKY